MASLQVPSEILQKIFSFISDTDIKTLYSCLFVSRTWCDNIVPILWKRPFNLPSGPPAKIVTVYVRFLDDTSKKQLGIRIVPSFERPAYDYPRFMRQIDSAQFDRGCTMWINE